MEEWDPKTMMEPGTRVVIVGGRSSGKTTLAARLISCIQDLTECWVTGYSDWRDLIDSSCIEEPLEVFFRGMSGSSVRACLVIDDLAGSIVQHGPSPERILILTRSHLFGIPDWDVMIVFRDSNFVGKLERFVPEGSQDAVRQFMLGHGAYPDHSAIVLDRRRPAVYMISGVDSRQLPPPFHPSYRALRWTWIAAAVAWRSGTSGTRKRC